MGRFFRPVLWLSLIVLLSTGFFVFIKRVDAAGPPADVMINEIKINPTCAGGDNEYIELWNSTGSDIDLNGWKVNSAIFGNLDISLYLSSASTVIPANGLLLIEMGCSPANNTGDVLQVLDAADNSIYAVSYGDMDPGMGVPHVDAPGLGESAILLNTGSYVVTTSSSKGWFNDAVDYPCDVTSSSTPPTLSSVDACLSSEEGVTSNMGEMTNYTSVTGLYFEKAGKGRIFFEGTLNLTDQTVVTNIANLGQKMGLGDGQIVFDSEMAQAMGETGAALEMYGFDAYGYNGVPEIYVYDDDGIVIPPGDPNYPIDTSTIDYDTGTLTFDVEHFTEFGTGPSVTEVTPVPAYTNTTTPSYVFGTNVTGTYIFSGDCAGTGSGSTTNGNNSMILGPLTEAAHSNCAVKVIDGAGNSTTLQISPFTVDTASPVLSSTSASNVAFTSATLNFTTNEAGTYYYLVYLAPSGGMLGGFPNAAKVKAQGTAVTKGTAAASVGAISVGVTGLTASKLYNAYVIVEDAAGNLSAVSKIPFGATIQSMIDAASPGDTITVPTGTFNENITINKAITLIGDIGSDGIGAGPSAPVIIDSAGNNRTVNITASGVTFRGFIVENNGSSYPAVRIATGISSSTVKNNTLRNAYSGITLASGSENNTITKNKIYNNTEGLFLNGSVKNTISNNEIYNCSDNGIEFVGNTNAGGNDIKNNDIYSNTWHGIHLGSYLDTSDGTILIDSNTIHLNGRSGVQVENDTSEVNITNNTIESNGQSELSTGIHMYSASGNLAHGNTIISDNSDLGVVNSDSGNVFDATMNWWGYASGPYHSSNTGGEGDQVSDDVNFSPWYGEAAMTSLRGVPTEDGDTKTYTITEEYNITTGTYTMEIPANTTVTGTTAWDGSINPPTVTTLTDPPSQTGYTTTMGNTIEVGFSGGKLLLSNAAKLTFAGQSGKKVGYKVSGQSFVEITTVCGANTQVWADGNLSEGGDCKIDSGSDLVVWTKHFTVFATYAMTQNEDDDNGGGGSSGGGTTYNQIAPTNPSVVINSGAASADSVYATLTLSAVNATEMAISNSSDFVGASWEQYNTSKAWTLSSGAGTKTVYVKFRAGSGAATAAVTDTITLTELGASTAPATTSDTTTGGTTTGGYTTGETGVPEDPNSAVVMNTTGTSGIFQPGGSVSFGYQYQNQTSSTLYVKIVRELLNSKGNVVKKLTAYKTIKAGTVFKANVKEMLSPNMASGLYTMRVRIYNARTTKLLAQNSFKIWVKSKSFVFSALPAYNAISFSSTTFNKMKKTRVLPATVTLRYSYTNLTDTKQSIKMVRELVGPDGKVIASRSGRWSMVPGEKDSAWFIQYIAKKYAVGDYKLRVRALDYSTGTVLAENAVDFKIEMR